MAQYEQDTKDLQWITVNGKHIPLGEGETKADAIRKAFGDNRSVADHNEDVKEQQIAKAKAERDRLNGKSNSKATATVETQAQHKNAVKELGSDKYADGTYDIATKKPVEFNSGFQVTFCQIGDNYSDEDYAKKVNECLTRSSDGKTYAGKFESTPEISFHFNDREEAIRYARANNQISIWDWENMDCIDTGGTGDRNKKKR